ncbi:tRNA (guanosine(46)-N7)-methyltransferase TrmB [Alginatibacterium sediminis]|uniref:tRNA (guanine-N(7)-)-methyltransferase n=1 Tax=Alginatibacterium sediminis TaxID=2164068 RepID=A0A420E8J5_9ALTE|nr:tRNA (guanosine(46)-N7)-methyltransferase TrmB [Alginatibacterium sediminis]RKF15673.1 tRNA (guanosine(46)-N7)-methyltransferase TrmB [Alginatibacterium sediminis]
MSDSSDPTPQGEKRMRQIRSFVLREGRLTNRQQNALENLGPKYLLEVGEQFLDFELVFGRRAPVVLEIGFGMGRSLVEMAKSQPEKDFIGIEVHRPGVGACIADADEQGVENLRVFAHDAIEVLQKAIPEQTLSTLQLFFPDPWHKKRHNKRRIVQSEFAQQVRNKLIDGGVFHMATDWENYAEHMLEVMSQAPGYQNLSSTGDYVERPDWRPLTKFEDRGHRLGHGVWDLMFKRV